MTFGNKLLCLQSKVLLLFENLNLNFSSVVNFRKNATDVFEENPYYVNCDVISVGTLNY